MLMNGPETPADPKATPAAGSKTAHAAVPAPAPAARTATRRRRERQESAKPNSEERFFLAEADGKGDTPALGPEYPSEAEAIIEAFRAKVSFYRVTEYKTRADIGPSGEPILKKEALKKNSPAS